MTYEQISALVMEENTDCVYISDPETYELLYLNRTLLNLIGDPDEKGWLGHPCHLILQNKTSPCEFCNNQGLSSECFTSWTHYNEMMGRFFRNRAKLIRLNGKPVRLQLATDSTELEQSSANLLSTLHAQTTLISCIQTLNENKDTKQAIQKLLSLLCEYYKAERAYIFELDDPPSTLSNTYEWSRKDVEPQIGRLQKLPLETVRPFFENFEKNGEFYMDSVENFFDPSSPLCRLLRPQNIKRLMAAPLKQEDRLVGLLGVDNPAEHCPDMMLLRSISSFIVNDINERKLTQKLTEYSLSDTLTGTGNRRKYIRDLNSFDKMPPSSLGVVYLDINGLKTANDTRGHRYGDYLIQHAANVITGIFPKHLYRIGGDEFVVLCSDVSQAEFSEKVELLRKAKKRDPEFRISIGASWSADLADLPGLIAHTDKLMYADKQVYYGMHWEEAGKSHAIPSKQLLQEIREGRFVVYLQPKVDLKTGVLSGAEALVRKLDSDGAILPPVRFIPKYESEGIIRHVDFFVFRTVLNQLREWRERGFPALCVAVNFSRLTLMEHHIADTLKELCGRYDVPAEQIMIEVTESIGTMTQEELQELIFLLRKAGFSISLDDFGSEYSSLAILSALDFDEIKLDKSLIDHLVSNPKARVIASHTIKVCKEFRQTTSVAEGIETEEQNELLKELHCDIGQGYYYNRPMSVPAFTQKYFITQKEPEDGQA